MDPNIPTNNQLPVNNQSNPVLSNQVDNQNQKPLPTNQNLPPYREVLPKKIPSIFTKLTPVFLIFGVVSFGALIYVLLQNSNKPAPKPIVETIVVTPTPNPTPIRITTAISTTSAYIDLEKSANDFSTALTEFSKDDPTLTPPSLVLPLGF